MQSAIGRPNLYTLLLITNINADAIYPIKTSISMSFSKEDVVANPANNSIDLSMEWLIIFRFE